MTANEGNLPPIPSQPDLFTAAEHAARETPPRSSPGQERAAGARHDHARALYDALRMRLAETVIGHAHARDQLALLGTRHALGLATVPLRAVLAGPSGCGKSTLVRALAQCLGYPYAVVDVTELAETNWSGLQIGDVLGDLWVQAGECPERMARSVIVLDEIDKLAAGRLTGVSRDYQLGRQRSLLPLLGGAPLRFTVPKARDRTLAWSSARALIIGAGVFGRLRPGEALSAAALIAIGFEHELVERMGQLLRLPPLSATQLGRVLRAGVEGVVATYDAFGIGLTIPEHTCGYVARAIADGKLRVGTRQATTLLIEAAQVKLVGLLEQQVPRGTVVALTPDDLDISAPANCRRTR